MPRISGLFFSLGFLMVLGSESCRESDGRPERGARGDQGGGDRVKLDAGDPTDAHRLGDGGALDPDAGSIEGGVAPTPTDGGASGVVDGAPMDARATPDGATSDDGGSSGDRDVGVDPDAASGTIDSGALFDGGLSFDGCVEGAPPLVGGGTTGPVHVLEEQGHGLPGCYRCGVGVADFDGDGRSDVVMAGAFDAAFTPGMGSYTYQNRVRLFRNASCTGQEVRFVFEAELPGVRGGGGGLVEIGDFDGDGAPDFAVQFREGDSPESDTSAFMNDGAGFHFTRTVLESGFDTNSNSMGMAVADIDRDGRDDLIFLSDGYGAGPGLWYRWDSGGGAWQAQQTSFTHAISYGGTIAAGDLDGDGFPDIAVGGNSSSPFGAYDCSSTLLYGQIHLNKGAGAMSPGIQPEALSSLGKFALRSNRSNPPYCTGMDNAGMRIADVDLDGHNDIVIAGSADAFQGPPGLNGTHYDFVVLRNVDGTGDNFVTFENVGVQHPNGTTNGGSGSLDFPNIAVGDLSGDGLPEIFIQGHHRDYDGDFRYYVYDSRLFLNDGGTSFVELDLGLGDVGNGGQAIVDLNNDGKADLLFTGASIAFHTNGLNTTDYNNASNLFARVYRNTRP